MPGSIAVITHWASNRSEEIFSKLDNYGTRYASTVFTKLSYREIFDRLIMGGEEPHHKMLAAELVMGPFVAALYSGDYERLMEGERIIREEYDALIKNSRESNYKLHSVYVSKSFEEFQYDMQVWEGRILGRNNSVFLTNE